VTRRNHKTPGVCFLGQPFRSPTWNGSSIGCGDTFSYIKLNYFLPKFSCIGVLVREQIISRHERIDNQVR